MSSDFDIQFPRKTALITRAANQGLVLSGMRLLRDSIMEEPKVPHDEGTLRGSGSVFHSSSFGNTKFFRLAGTSEGMASGGNPTPARHTSQAKQTHGSIEVLVGFNTPYAARLHEHPEYNFTEAGTGGKYLERKMVENRDRYMKIVQKAIKDAARGA